MSITFNNWYVAGAKLREIQEVCEAFQRGDQPEKIRHLSVDSIVEICETLIGITEFCVKSLQIRRCNIEFRDHETYRYARNYGRTLAQVLLRRQDVPLKTKERLEEWLLRERDFPPINVMYV